MWCGFSATHMMMRIRVARPAPLLAHRVGTHFYRLLKGLDRREVQVARKFVVAMMMHETNTFSPLATPIDSFARAGALSGPVAIKEAEGTNTSLGGFIEVALKSGAALTGALTGSA